MIIDEGRLKRQQQVVQKWIDNKYVGTLIAATGTGKTYTAILAIAYIQSKRPEASVLVVVPTIYLKEQWEKVLGQNNIPNVEVQVINTACKTIQSCDVLIIDEVHITGADQFSEVFTNISYKTIFCLTATLERSDGKEELIKQFAPIIDRITIKEALDSGYISNYRLYNIPVELTSKEKIEYQKIIKTYGFYEFLLGGKFNAWEKANNILKFEKDNKEAVKNALGFLRTVNKRKQFLNNLSNKIAIVSQILQKYPDRKAVVFSESIQFAERIAAVLPNQSTIYHSTLSKKEKDKNISDFINSPNIRVLSSVKALDTGMDIPNISLGISCAGSSRSLQAIQRLGRTIRTDAVDKLAIFFNIYLKGSQEEKWIKNKCQDIPNVYYIDNLEEI